MAKLRVSLSMKNKSGVQGDDRATYSVLFLPVSVPISTHTALLTVCTSSLIALFQLPLLLPWFNSLLLVSPQALAVGHDLVSQALSSPLYSTLHSLGQSFASPQMHCPPSHYILALYFWLLLSRLSFLCRALFFICLAPIFLLTFCLAPVSFDAVLSLTVSPSLALISFAPLFFISLAPFFWVTFCLNKFFFAPFLSLSVSPHSFGFMFVSSQCFLLSSLSYNLISP